MNESLFILIIGGFFVILSLSASLFWFGGLLIPALYRGAPFIPSTGSKTRRMIALAKLSDQDQVIDLGSGDGRFLLEAIRAGAGSAQGYELHPGLVWLSRWRAHRQGFASSIQIHRVNYFHADLSNATVVMLYQLPGCMERLETKLLRELPAGARVISNTFSFPNWSPIYTEHNIFVYQKSTKHDYNLQRTERGI